MTNRPDSLLGRVVQEWEDCGRPRWDLAETVRKTIAADQGLEGERLNPAQAFRRHRRALDLITSCAGSGAASITASIGSCSIGLGGSCPHCCKHSSPWDGARARPVDREKCDAIQFLEMRK